MKPRLLSLLFVPLILAGCAQMPESGSNPPVSQAVDSLDAFHWQLTSATDRTGQRLDTLFVQPDKPVQIDFKVNRFTLTNTCNIISGHYHLTENTVSFSDMASTRRLCTPPMNALEQQISSQFAKNADMDILLSATPILTLRFMDGNTLTFAGHPTADIRYGGRGETIFMEIASETVICNLPGTPARQCLKAREVSYDNNGVITQTGTWKLIPANIEGYQHDGKAHTLRLKRYHHPHPATNASEQIYIMDMLVQ